MTTTRSTHDYVVAIGEASFGEWPVQHRKLFAAIARIAAAVISVTLALAWHHVWSSVGGLARGMAGEG
jgi:hypothetical protein